MSGKDSAKHAIQALLDDSSVGHFIDAPYIRAKCDRGAREARDGIPRD